MTYDSAPSRVIAHLETYIRDGQPGDRLPSVRALMAELGVSPGTVRAGVAELVRTGRVETRSGNGTFVASPPALVAAAGDRSWQSTVLGSFDVSSNLLSPLRIPAGAGLVDLASGYPDATLQPTRLLARVLRSIAKHEQTFDKAPARGLNELRRWFTQQLGPDTAHDCLISPGGQAAISLIFRSLALPGDNVMMESPTYLGAIGAAKSAGLNPVPIRSDAEGIDLTDLQATAESSGAKLLYLQPRFHNPTGVTLAPSRRTPLLELAAAANLVIIEDDWIRDLDDPTTAIPPLAANDPDGHIIHVASLTKSLSPAVRIAGISARGAISQRLAATQGIEDFFVSPILQRTALEAVASPAWPAHLRELKTRLKQRTGLLQASLAATGLDNTSTAGVFHTWLRVPSDLDTDLLAAATPRHGVAIVSGTNWYPADQDAAHIRLSIAAAAPEEIPAGIEGLANAIRQLTE